MAAMQLPIESSPKEASDPVTRVSNSSGKTNLRKSESLKNIPSESQSEIRDHVTALRRYHSFKGSSSHRKVKGSGAASILKKAKLSSSSTPRTSANTTVTVSPPVASDMKTNVESSNLSSDNSPEHSPEGVFTRTGWLMRQTFNKDWSRHWFVLRDSSLTYYRDPSAEHCGIMDGILDLNQVSSIRETDSDRYYSFNLLMWDGKKMVLATETDDFRKMWIQALHYASNLWSSASKEDFICSEIVLPEHNFHHSERISSPSSLSSLPYVLNSTMTETSSSSSDDQSEYFSLVDEDEQLLNSMSPMWPWIVIHKNEVWANGTSEQTHMGKKYLLTVAIPDYRPSIENVELSLPVQHNASPDKNSRTTVMVSLLDVTGIKPYPDLSPNQNALRIASGTEPTLIRKEDTTPLTIVQFLCSLHHCKRWRRWSTFNGMQRSGRQANRPPFCRPRAATTNLSNSCTCGLERFPSARNDTFLDSELCGYTGDGTPLLQLSDHSSTCEVVQVSDLSSSPRTLPPSPPINRNMMSLVKEKSRIRSTCGQKTSTPIDDITTNSNHDNQAEPVYHKDNLGINEEEEADIDEIAHRLMNGDFTVSPSKLRDESLDHLSKVKESMKFRLDFGDQFSKKELDKGESTFETPDVSFGKSSPCGNSDVSTPNSEAAIECSVCLRVKSKLAAAKDEIRKLKEELKEAYANFDNLEMRSYKLAQDMKVKEENYSSQIALMTAKIDDLTSKFSLAEKNYRQLKQKTMKSDGKERKRSSLKNKEGLTLTKEYELKLCDLEKKIASIENTILKESTASNNSSKQSMQEAITPSESIDNGASAESPSSNTKGFFSRLQSLGSKVQNVNNLVSENNHSSKGINSPEIRLEVRDNVEPNIIDEASDDYWAVSLDKSLKSLNKYLEGHPANLSECQSVFIRKMNKILKWLKTSLDNICKQGSRENNLANEKNLLVQNIIDLLTSLCIETPKDTEEPKQARTCYALLMAFESMRLLERVDCVDSIDSLVKFDITECAFKVIIKTLCLVFAEYENTEISTILQLISRIPQIRFFCPMVNKLLPQSQEEDEQFSTVSERLQLLNDQRSFILTSLEEAKKVRHQSLCNTLIEVPVKDVNISKPETVNSIEQYITSIALDIHQIAELQLSGMQNQSSFLLQEEHGKIQLWCLEANKAIKNSFKAFMKELKEECPMVHESTISLFDLSDTTRQEITYCVTELSFICVSYTLLNMLLSDAIPGESVVENISTKSLTSPNYIDTMWEKFESSKSNFLSNPGFFECLQCTLLNNLLSGPNQNINWVDYIKKYNVYNPRKSNRLNFLIKYRGSDVSSTCNNCDKFSASSSGNSKDACNNLTCTECEKWIKKFCTSEKQHELERQALESKYTRELQQLEECLTKSNKVHEQEMLRKENELESTTVQLQRLKDEVETLAYQLNEEAERTERPIRRLSKVMYGSTCADMQVDVMGECLSSIKHVVGVRSVFLAKRLHAV
ncbi:protein outspread [Trichonephila clavipes]|nr:protein outspread [Trichonephila clavipes]